MNEPTNTNPQPQLQPVRRRRQVSTTATDPNAPPATATAATLIPNPAPEGVSEPPELPEGLLDTEGDGDFEDGPSGADFQAPLGEARGPEGLPGAGVGAASPPEVPKRRGRPKGSVNAPRSPDAAAAAAPAAMQPRRTRSTQAAEHALAEPSEEDLRALGRLTLLARQRGLTLEEFIAEVRAMIAAYDRFG